MKVLFATAELAPLVRVGGLSYAAAGLVRQLHAEGIEVTVVLPDYGTYDAALGDDEPLDMPGWVGITTIRRGTVGDGVPLVAVRTPAIERPHPYNDGDGRGWQDNDFRFMAFSAAVAELADHARPGRPPRQRLAHRRLPGDGAPAGALGVHHPQPGLPGDGRRGLGRDAPPPARGLRVARHGEPDVGGDRPGRPGGGGEPQLRPRDPPAGGRVRPRRAAPGEG